MSKHVHADIVASYLNWVCDELDRGVRPRRRADWWNVAVLMPTAAVCATAGLGCQGASQPPPNDSPQVAVYAAPFDSSSEVKPPPLEEPQHVVPLEPAEQPPDERDPTPSEPREPPGTLYAAPV